MAILVIFLGFKYILVILGFVWEFIREWNGMYLSKGKSGKEMNRMKLSKLVWMFQNKGMERNTNEWNVSNPVLG